MPTKTNWRLALFILITGVQAATAEEYLNPKWSARQSAARKAAVLPPVAELKRAGMKGDEGLIEESEAVAAALQAAVARALPSAGLRVIPNPFTEPALRQRPGLRYELRNMQTRYAALESMLMRNGRDVPNGRFSMGDEVCNVNPDGAADVLAFVRWDGTAVTAGKKAYGVFMIEPKRSTADLTVTLVDAFLGDVLFFTRLKLHGNIVDPRGGVLSEGGTLDQKLRQAFGKLGRKE